MEGRSTTYPIGVSNRQGPRDIYALDVGMRVQSGREPVRVTTGMGVQSVDLSTDGTRVVYAVYRSTANIWAMPIPRGHTGSFASAVQVTSENQTVEGVRVSPDGRWLIYDSDLSGTSAVYRVPVAGGDAERLTHGPFDAFRGTLSPNGAELVYHSFQTGSRELFLEPLNGGPVRQLTRSSGGSRANWSPDGRELYFKSHDVRGRASFWSVSIAGGRPRLLARLDDSVHASNRFEFASDGKRFYFTIEDRQSDIWVAEVTPR